MWPWHLQALESVKKGRQAMVFVHSRKDTGKTGRFLITKMQNASDAGHFECKDHPQYGFASKDIAKSRNKYARLPAACFPSLQSAQGTDCSADFTEVWGLNG